MNEARGWALGIDVGGTHTDMALVSLADGRAWRHKLASTPDDPARAVGQGMREILATSGVVPHEIIYLAHGTTVATNALVQRRTARAALVTTAGFRDVLEIRRQRQPHAYNTRIAKPAPPIARQDRYEVNERHFLLGREAVAPRRSEVEALANRLREEAIEAVAVCFLHAYDDPGHERRVGEWLRDLLPGVFVTLSSEVIPEPREYERTATTAINACLGPVMSGYLARIEAEASASGIVVEPAILQSNGGVATARDAARWPVRTLASGPAAGVIGAVAAAKAVGVEDVITFDVGGTTADVCLVERSTPLVAAEREIAGYPVRFPMTDVHSVGAGGGSIARIDDGGFLHVGPTSAGADPGPAAYGRGGELATVTDACVVLGHLSPSGLLRGRLPLDIEASRRAIATHIASPLEMSVEAAAAGILTIVNENMVQAVRVISVERGFDPRRFALIAFGGAGPLLCRAIAHTLGIERVLVPPSPGLLCAQGLLEADERADFSLTRLLVLDADTEGAVRDVIAELRAAAVAWFDAGAIPLADRAFAFAVDMRYRGQSHELRIELPAQTADPMAALVAGLRDAHCRTYGFAPDAPAQTVAFRVAATAPTHRAHDTGLAEPGGEIPPTTTRHVHFPGIGSVSTCPVIQREALTEGDVRKGPLVVEQMDATTLLAPGDRVTVQEDGMLHVEIAAGG
jgi:N-methylhydantoinase A